MSLVAGEASAIALDVDYVALALVVLQAVLLYHIVCKAESLRGSRLLTAAKAVHAQKAAKRRESQGHLQLDKLEPAQHAMLLRARTAFVQAGGVLDEFWEPFLLRFLVGAEWDEALAKCKLADAARWRLDYGASAIREQFAAGRKLGQQPAFAKLLSAMGIAFAHRRTSNGDLLTIGAVGSFEPDIWFSTTTDDERTPDA